MQLFVIPMIYTIRKETDNSFILFSDKNDTYDNLLLYVGCYIIICHVAGIFINTQSSFIKKMYLCPNLLIIA